MENAVPLGEVATHIDALVARDAAKRLEKLVAGNEPGTAAALGA
jgi:hypothetical protein